MESQWLKTRQRYGLFENCELTDEKMRIHLCQFSWGRLTQLSFFKLAHS